MEAAGLFAGGVKAPEVARRLRVSEKSAYQWHQAWRQGGTAALVSRGPGGRRCRLSPRCQEKLAAYLEQVPDAHGWDQEQVWTGARVAALIGRKFHVLQRLGCHLADAPPRFTPQVPVRRAAERDEEAVESWKEATWAEVRAPGRPATGSSASKTRPVSPADRPRPEPGAGEASRRS